MNDKEEKKETLGEVVSKTIRKYRKKMGLTQKQLAEAIGKTESIIRKYENGSVFPPYETMLKLSKALEIDPMILVCGDEGLAEYVYEKLNSFRLPEQYDTLNEILKFFDMKIEYISSCYFLTPLKPIDGNAVPVYISTEEIDNLITDANNYLGFKTVRLYNEKKKTQFKTE
jgi:transcriptional regulator with XRE-family HTH domain